VLKSLWMKLLLSALAAGPALADACDSQAAKFAERPYLKVSPRMAGDFFLLTDERFPRLGARLVCNGPHGMAVSSVSPPRLEENWIDIVAELGSVLTGEADLSIASGIRDCVSNPQPQLDDLLHQIDYQAHDFYISCDSNSDGQIEFSVTKVD
jgi:hypothetical protein